MKFKNTYWTSEFNIISDIDFSIENIEHILNIIEQKYSKFNPFSDSNNNSYDFEFILESTNLLEKDLIKFINYDNSKIFDFTGILKGLALHQIYYYLMSVGSKSFYINFGGDIVTYNYSLTVNIEDSNLNLVTGLGTYCIFTSGNTNKRGNHIKVSNFGLKFGDTCTVVIKGLDPILADYLATWGVSQLFDKTPDIPNYLNISFYYTRSGKCTIEKSFGKAYIASPFFNKKEIRIRDKILTCCEDYFRPDSTEIDKDWKLNHTKDLALKIYHDNIDHIKSCDYLIFPKYTDDLGTLFEVGVAIKLEKPIFRYDYKLDKFEKLDYSNYKPIEVIDQIIDCTKKSGAILAGYNFENPFKYYIGDLNDNLMLSSLHDRYDLIDETWVKVESDMEIMH